METASASPSTWPVVHTAAQDATILNRGMQKQDILSLPTLWSNGLTKSTATHYLMALLFLEETLSIIHRSFYPC